MGKKNEISVEKLIFAFKSGAIEVMNQKNDLNKINVFPVADGDTGSNLSSLMKGIYGFTYDQKESVETNFNQLSEATLVGARGNSGSIFAQYFCGLLQQLKLKDSLTQENFALSASQAVAEAYQAIDYPQEGTMLSVIKSWAESLQENSNHADSFQGLLEVSLEEAHNALKATKNQLKVLKQKDVVDAGGKGFYLFIKGITAAIGGKTQPLVAVSESLGQLTDSEHHEQLAWDDLPEYRYCTEVLLSDLSLSKEELKNKLRPYGDSLIVAGTNEMTKIHLHSNQPGEVIKELQTHGKMLDHKADDMLNQYEIKNNQKYPIALVTDSIADLPLEYILNEQIQVLPLNLLIDDQNYLDKVTIDSDDLWRYPEGTKMSSAQPGLKVIENMFNFLTSYYQQIIVITVAGKLSGTHSVVQKISQKYQGTDSQIAVIDSYQNSAAQGLLVMQAAEWIKEGKPFEEIVSLVSQGRSKVQILVSVPELTAMIRSGRLSTRAGKIAQWVNLKPLVSLDQFGAGKIAGVAFSLAKNEGLLQKKVQQKNDQQKIKKYAVVHAGSPERGQKMATELEQLLGFPASYIMDISSVVAMSAGQGSVAVAVLQEVEERRQEHG